MIQVSKSNDGSSVRHSSQLLSRLAVIDGFKTETERLRAAVLDSSNAYREAIQSLLVDSWFEYDGRDLEEELVDFGWEYIDHIAPRDIEEVTGSVEFWIAFLRREKIHLESDLEMSSSSN